MEQVLWNKVLWNKFFGTISVLRIAFGMFKTASQAFELLGVQLYVSLSLMPGGFSSWQEEQQSLLLRTLFAGLLFGVYSLGIFEVNVSLMRFILAMTGVQIVISYLGIPPRWPWLPNFNFFINRIALVLLMGASGGATSPFIAVSYMTLVGALIWFNTPRAVLILLGSHLLTLALGNLVALALGFSASWNYALLHAVGLTVIAYTLARPLSQLNHRAATDPLTQALNRRGGLEALETWVAQRQKFSLIFIDLKHFKRINDTYGHAVGDELLTWLVQICRTNLRSSDLVIRYGGDEFVLAVTGQTQPLIQRLEGLLSAGVQTSAGHLSVQANLGVVRFPGDAEQLEPLLKLADELMYRHKGAELAKA